MYIHMMSQRAVVKICTPKLQHEGGGFLVRKVIGGVIASCDPFLMLDHIGPVDNKPGEAVGAPDHPHRGFEIVTYVIDGGCKHKDSCGNKGVLKEGWVQWIAAGSGVVHSEMPTDAIVKHGGRTEGFQLWVNLPKTHKMMSPRYQDVPPDKIPVVTSSDGKVAVKVLSGESLGVKTERRTIVPILLLDIHLQPGSEFTQVLPESYRGFVYVWRGAGFLSHSKLAAHLGQVGLLGDKGTQVYIKAEDEQDCHVLLVAGEPIGEPIVKFGPFVMNTQEEIDQAIADSQAGRLGSIPGKEERLKKNEAAQILSKKNGSAK